MQDTIWAKYGNVKIASITDLPRIESASGRLASDWMTEQANARLIAAAPELFAACHSANLFIAASLANALESGHIQQARKISVVLTQIQAAIAKAQGGAA